MGLSRWKRAAAIVSLLAFTHPLAAQPPVDRIAQRVPEPFKGYNRDCGYPIIFEDTLHISTAQITQRLGAIITLDPLLAQPTEDAHRRFLIAHECAHHRLGHTTFAGLRARWTKKGIEDQELSADCWAAEALVRSGLQADARRMVDIFFRKGLHSPGGGYPSGVQRSTIVLHCMRIEARKRLAATPSNMDKPAEAQE